jgi:hypothetical protein
MRVIHELVAYFDRRGKLDPERSAQSGDELAPLVSLGYALPTLGQVATLVFIPFAAWYVDQALEPVLDLEAARGGNVFEVDPAEGGGHQFNRPHDLVGVGGERRRSDAGRVRRPSHRRRAQPAE